MAKPVEFSPGVYLTNGTDLFQVIRTWAPSGQVLLEDCRFPDMPLQAKSVRELVADGCRVVRPENYR